MLLGLHTAFLIFALIDPVLCKLLMLFQIGELLSLVTEYLSQLGLLIARQLGIESKVELGALQSRHRVRQPINQWQHLTILLYHQGNMRQSPCPSIGHVMITHATALSLLTACIRVVTRPYLVMLAYANNNPL
jgi:hypothetical protein